MRGSIVRKAGRWYVIIEQHDPQTGARRRKWHSGYRTRREAEAARVELLSRVFRGTYVEPSRRSFGSYLTDEWLPAIRSTVRASTFAGYQRTIRTQILPRLGSRALQHLTPGLLNAFYGELLQTGRIRREGGLAPNTVRNIHVVVHKSLGDAVRWGRIPRNPADYADPPAPLRPGASPMRVWTAEQLGDFLHFMEGDRLYAAWVLAATTGMRRGEVLGLRWEDADLEAGRVAVRRSLVSVDYKLTPGEPKTARGRRSIALDRWTASVLREHRRRHLEERMLWGPAYENLDLVFCRENGAPIHPDRFTKLFDRAVEAAGLPRIRLHDLRHTYATLALRQGAHPKVVSERLGHSTVSITLDTYSHVIPDLQEEVAEAVGSLIAHRAVENR